MKRAGGLLCSLVLLLPIGCVPNAKPAGSVTVVKAWSGDAQRRRDQMVGKWLSEYRTADGVLQLAVAQRSANGTYRITFRIYAGGAYEESVEVGLWGTSGPVYFTIMRGWMDEDEFRSADANRAYYYDAYKIVRLDATTFEYESLETGDRHSARRVGDDFEFSD